MDKQTHLVIVPVVADVGDSAARARVPALSVPPAVLGDSLDGRLTVLLAQPLAELFFLPHTTLSELSTIGISSSQSDVN